MNGWVAAVLYLLLAGVGNLFWKMGAHLDLYPAVYVSQGMMAGGLMLLLLSRPGKLAIETVKNPNTWLFGVFYYGVGTLTVYVLNYVDIVQMMVLTRVSVPISFLIVLLFLDRGRYTGMSYLSQAVVIAGIALMALTLPPETFGIGLIGCIMIGVFHSLRALTVEMHKPNNQAKTFEQEIRVTGFVMAMCGWAAYIFFMIISFFNSSFDLGDGASSLPTIHQVFSYHSIILGSVYGMFVISLFRYLEFYAIKRIKSEYFMGVLSFSVLSGLGLDWFADWIGLMPLHSREIPLVMIASIAVFVLGSLGFVMAGRKPSKESSKKGGKLAKRMRRDADIANRTLALYQGNVGEAAKSLGLTEALLNVALKETDCRKALPEKVSDRIDETYRQRIVNIDPKTSLVNQNYFLEMLKAVLERGDHGVVLFIDLNKFKPINDKHGHDAGDEVLRVVAQRLINASSRNSVVARLGGDEFGVMLTNARKENAAEIKQRIQDAVKAPIKLICKKGQVVEVGASVGSVVYPEDGTDAEELLRKADELMYEDKKGKGR
jgi:diguanylate cyclase (GGDEF)-like protein